MGNQTKCWNFSANRQFDQNVKIWAKKGRLIKCWYSIAKVEIYQIIGIWLKNKELIRILKFEYNIKNQSNCWNLSAKCQFSLRETIINHNVEIWVQMWESMEMFKIEGRLIKCWYFIAKVGIDQNVGIWLKNKELIRILKFEYKAGSIKMLKFEWKRGDWSDQMLIFYCQSGNWSKCWNLIEK